MLKQTILSTVDYIATLPGIWQVGAYLSILALIVGFFRALPVIIQFLSYLLQDALKLAGKYLWRGLRHFTRYLFTIVKTAISNPSERPAPANPKPNRKEQYESSP